MNWTLQWRPQSLIAMRAIVLLFIPWIIVALEPTDVAMRAIEVRQAGGGIAWPSKSKRWALVIGVDKYSDTQITTLGGSSNDAKSIAEALVRYAGFPQDQVVLLTTDQPAERQPTRGNILRRLSNLASVMPADGLLFFSFAGHGMERSNQAFLLPSDSQVSNDVDLLEQTAINVTQIKNRIRSTGVKQVVMVLDACRNDPAGRANADNPLTAAYLRGFNFDVRNSEVTAFATLYATAVGERAYEYTEKHQGYFTWELVQGLKGAAANEKGEITLAALLKYVQERVPKRVLADLGSGKEQRPFADIGGYQADQLIIAVAQPNAPLTPAPTKLASTAPPQPRNDQAAFELSYWETIKNSKDPDDFKSYLERYPDGQFAELAMKRAQLKSAAAGQGVRDETAPEPQASTAMLDTANSKKRQIAELLSQAKSAYASGFLARPAGTSAADRYRAVLRLQPQQADAVEGLQRVAETLVVNAERANKSGDTDEALKLLDQARSVQPDNPRIARVQSDIEKRKVKLQRRDQADMAALAEHLTRAKAYLDRTLSLHNVAEANDQYDAAASLNANSPELKALHDRIVNGYLNVAQAELTAKRPSGALKAINYAQKRKMTNPQLDQFEASVQQQTAKK